MKLLSRPEAVTCSMCNREFQQSKRRLKKMQQGEVYCSACARKFQHKIPEPDHDVIVDLYLMDRQSAAKIAEMYNVTNSTILRLLKRYGVPILKATDYVKLGIIEHPTKGKGHTEDAIAKIRAASEKQFSTQAARDMAAHRQAKAIADGKFPVISGVEQKVAAELDTLGIIYTQQYPIRHPQTGRFIACADFMLSTGEVIEVNGTYWHSDPRFYPDGPVHASQKRSAEAYTKKAKALKELSIPLIEIWEHDVDINLSQSVLNALKYGTSMPAQR